MVGAPVPQNVSAVHILKPKSTSLLVASCTSGSELLENEALNVTAVVQTTSSVK